MFPVPVRLGYIIFSFFLFYFLAPRSRHLCSLHVMKETVSTPVLDDLDLTNLAIAVFGLFFHVLYIVRQRNPEAHGVSFAQQPSRIFSVEASGIFGS
jgi:hypothetical protein